MEPHNAFVAFKSRRMPTLVIVLGASIHAGGVRHDQIVRSTRTTFHTRFGGGSIFSGSNRRHRYSKRRTERYAAIRGDFGVKKRRKRRNRSRTRTIAQERGWRWLHYRCVTQREIAHPLPRQQLTGFPSPSLRVLAVGTQCGIA